MNKNRKVLFITLSCVVLCLIILFSILIYFKVDKNKKEQLKTKKEKEISLKVDSIYSNYSNFKDGNKIEINDSTAEFLNKQIDTHEQINSYQVDEITITDLENYEDSIAKIDDSLAILDNLKFDDINTFLDESNYIQEEKDALKEIYDESTIVKNIDADNKTKYSLNITLNNNKNILEYLKESSDKYTITNNTLVYTDDIIASYLSDKQINFTYEKAVDNGKRIPILMYHAIDDYTWGDSSLFVKISSFEEQMKYLSEHGFTALFLSEIGSAANYDKPVIITFDDGYKNVYDYAFPILQKYNLKSDFYIISRWMDGQTYVTPDMVKEMDASGIVEIGVHTLTHAQLGTLSYEEQYKELSECKSDLETLLGKSVTTVAYPYGSYNANTVNISKGLFSYGVTVTKDANYSSNYSALTLNRYNVYRSDTLEDFISYVEG